MQPELLSPPIYKKPTKEKNDGRSELLDKTTDEDIVSAIVERYDKSQTFQDGYMQLFRDLWNLWRFYKSADSAVKIYDPVGFALSIGMLSKLFVKPPRVLLTSTTGQWRWLSKILQAYLEHQFANPDSEEPMEEEFISFVTELLVTGTAVGKVCWKTKFNTVYEDVDGKRVGNRVKGFDDPVFEYVPLENFYFQPGATKISDSTYCIMEKWVDEDYIRDYKEITDPQSGQTVYKYIDEILAEGSYGETPDDKADIKAAKRPSEATNDKKAYEDRYHLMEYWEDDVYCVIVNKKWLIRGVEDNPYDHGKKPFIKMEYTKVPGEWYGIGALEPIADLQKATNIGLTQRFEYVANLLNQQFAVISTADVDEDAIIEGYPIIHTNTADAITPLNKGSVPQSSFVNAQEITGAIERGMGISGYSVGAPSSAEDKTQGTLGGIRTIVNEAATRFDMTLRRFENIVLKKVAQLFLDLDRQYFSEFEQRVVLLSDGQIPAPITKEILQMSEWRVNIVPGSTGVIDKQEKLNSFMAWTKYSADLLPDRFNRELAVIESAEYQDVENPERFILPPVAPPQMPNAQPVTPPVGVPNGQG